MIYSRIIGISFALIFFVIGLDVDAASAWPSQVKILNQSSLKEETDFTAFSDSFAGGVNVAVGDIDGDKIDEIVVGSGPGDNPVVKVFEGTGQYAGLQYFPFHEDFRGGITVAAGDVDGDGVDEMVFGQGSLGESWVKIYETNGRVRGTFIAYGRGLESGVNLAVGDINGDNKAEIITGAGNGGGPHVRVFNNRGTRLPIDIFPFHPDFRGGVSMAVGNVDGRSGNEIIMSQASEGEIWVKVYKPDGEVLANERLYPPYIEVGANVLTQDVDGDGIDEIVTGAGFNGGPEIKYFKYKKGTIEYLNKRTMAFDERTRNGVNIAGGDVDGDGVNEIITGAGTLNPARFQDLNLNIPYHHQELSLSCEAATVKMALNYKGVDISEADIINQIGFDNTPKDGNIWGDPHKAFVGRIDGKQISSGYGVYWEPIARVANNYRKVEHFTNGDLINVLREVAAGNPVIVWGMYANNNQDVYWETPEKKRIHGVIGEHTRVIKGFVGNINNPSYIRLLDPARGEINMETGYFLDNWARLGYSGVFVR